MKTPSTTIAALDLLARTEPKADRQIIAALIGLNIVDAMTTGVVTVEPKTRKHWTQTAKGRKVLAERSKKAHAAK